MRIEKVDINNDYGIYQENGYVTTEVEDQNAAYESHSERKDPDERHESHSGKNKEDEDKDDKDKDPEDQENWEDDYDQMYMK